MKKELEVVLQNNKVTSVLYADGAKDLASYLAEYGQNVIWVFDTNTSSLFSSLPHKKVVLSAGELYKTWESVDKILSTAMQFGAARDTLFIAFGGGVICDLVAYAASIYMRGCRLVLVPTTLLAMVDASLGGKSGIDYMGVKNMVGTFYPAEEVLIFTDALKSLSEHEFKSGLGEVLKHAFLTDNDELYDFLFTNSKLILDRDVPTLLKMIDISLRVKKQYIEKDPEEKLGIRSFLNLGHTFAHALESSSRFTSFSHGHAVAWGLSRAAEVGCALGITPQDLVDKINKLLIIYGYDPEYRIGRGDWINFSKAMSSDKKKYDGVVKFVLLEAQGKLILKEVDSKVVQKAVIARL